MALPILDGNQSATTLSTIVTGGQHIPAHTVVSLGSQAITDMRSAVSGSVVSISNFPASQTIAGTVTANIGDAISLVGGGYSTLTDLLNNETIAVRELPPISGTVTANLPALNYNTVKISFAEKSYYNGIYKKGTSGYVNIDGGGIPVYAPIDEKFSGGVDPVLTRSIQTGSGATFSGIRWNFQEEGDVQFYAATTATDLRLVTEWYDSSGEVSVSITPYSVEPVAIINSVTANNPSGALITRFGSVTTANTAQLTSAVTNTSRKYLLVQNIATSTVTIGIGFAPTTTQGIQLTAGAGLTFDAFCPTGGVWWLSSTTGSNFSILEG